MTVAVRRGASYRVVHSILSKASIAGLIVVAHILVWALFNHSSSREPLWQASVPVESFAVAEIIPRSSKWDKLPTPQVKLRPIPVAITAPQLVQFDEPQDVRVVGPSSPPRLSPIQSANIDDFAHRAGIQAGRPLIIVLAVQIGADGNVGAIEIVRGCGVAAADAAAIDYARLLHWVPGTVDHAPRSMRVILPVTLGAPPNPASFFERSAFNPSLYRTALRKRFLGTVKVFDEAAIGIGNGLRT